MIIQAEIEEKTMGSKLLLRDLSLTLQEKQKVAIIGRNGVGKSTLLGLLSGRDTEYVGDIHHKKGLVIGETRQEHTEVADLTVLEYVLNELPEYTKLKHTIESYPNLKDPTEDQLHSYTDAIERFSQLDYYRAEDSVLQELEKYQLNAEVANGQLSNLSGGQKRFVELVKIAESHVDLALIDEPTNHMDYVAKAEFITWLGAAKCAVVLVSHDRDVLAVVDQIIEVRDHQAYIFNGNYDAYLRQNSSQTVAGMNQYEVQTKTLINLKKQLAEANRKKASSSKTPNPFIPLVRRFERDIAELEKNLVKPSFWIDQDSAKQMQPKLTEQYEKYKARNIQVGIDQNQQSYQQLVTVRDLSIGYVEPLFNDVSFELHTGDKVELRGRNGAGKSTLIKALLSTVAGEPLEPKVFAGEIEHDQKLRLGYYEQEISPELLKLTLVAAIEQVYRAAGIEMNPEKAAQIASGYLFEPHRDMKLKLEQLSGGQKARFQLIKMLCNNPNLLVLDEPTNHLDLPSIEELENALLGYEGAILYVSHDNYFRDKLKGTLVQI
jgi:ATPase subunit of ABC transporter with duplicated ATPase domains